MKRLACVLVSFVGFTWAGMAAFAPEVLAQQVTVDEFRLVISAPRPDTPYPVTARRGFGHLAFVGEPLILNVSLVNDSGVVVEHSDPAGWIGDLQIDLLTSQGELVLHGVAFEVLRTVSARHGGAVVPTTIRAGEVQEVELLMKPDADIPPRAYRIRGSIPQQRFDGTLARITRVRLTAMTALEIVPVDSQADRLNVLYARAVRARLAMRSNEAREALSLLLSADPNSSAGWYELGLAWMQDGNCVEVNAAFSSVRRIMASDSDRSRTTTNPEVRRSVEARMSEILKRCG